jgi:hypothetical protein
VPFLLNFPAIVLDFGLLIYSVLKFKTL